MKSIRRFPKHGMQRRTVNDALCSNRHRCSCAKHSDSAAVLLVGKMIEGDLVPLFSSAVMDEYREVLHRKKSGFNSKAVDILLSSISDFGLGLTPSPSGEVLPDMKDLPFYEVVMEKRESDEAYPVTRNQKHFPARPYIVTPKEMLDIIKTGTTTTRLEVSSSVAHS